MGTVSFHNFKSQNFKLSISNPKSIYVAYLYVLSNFKLPGSRPQKTNMKFENWPYECHSSSLARRRWRVAGATMGTAASGNIRHPFRSFHRILRLASFEIPPFVAAGKMWGMICLCKKEMVGQFLADHEGVCLVHQLRTAERRLDVHPGRHRACLEITPRYIKMCYLSTNSQIAKNEFQFWLIVRSPFQLSVKSPQLAVRISSGGVRAALHEGGVGAQPFPPPYYNHNNYNNNDNNNYKYH